MPPENVELGGNERSILNVRQEKCDSLLSNCDDFGTGPDVASARNRG